MLVQKYFHHDKHLHTQRKKQVVNDYGLLVTMLNYAGEPAEADPMIRKAI